MKHLSEAEFEAMLAQFRASARSGTFACTPAPLYRTRARISWWPRVAAAVAATALLVAVPLYREKQQRDRAVLAEQDAQLLQQVDAEISQTVPDAMHPLVKLLSQPNEEKK